MRAGRSGGGESRYRAARQHNGGTAVGNLDITIAPFGDYAFVTVRNPNSFGVYLVNPTGLSGVTKGVPALAFRGTPLRLDQAGSAVKAEGKDAASIAAYGEQSLDLPDQNGWRQHLGDVERLATELLNRLKTPKSTAQDVPVVGDPRLELADLVTLQDPRVLMLDTRYRLERLRLEYAGGSGLAGSLGLREV